MKQQEFNISTRTMLRAVAIVLGTWLGINLIVALRQPLTWVLIAGFLAIGLNPLIRWLEKYTWRRRGIAITIVTLVIVAVFALLLQRVIPPLVDQTQSLISNYPKIAHQIQTSSNPLAIFIRQYHLDDTLRSNSSKIVTFVTGSFGTIFASSVNLIGISVTIFISMVYFLTGGPIWAQALKKSRFGSRYIRHEATINQMQQAISSYVIGNAITSIMAFVAALIILVILGINPPLPLAFIYGIFDIIPIVGATLGGILLVGVALFKSVTAAIIMLIFILVYQQAESSLLQPQIYGRALSLPNAVVFLAAVFGGALAGLLGALLAIPLAACIRVAILAYLQQSDANKRRAKKA